MLFVFLELTINVKRAIRVGFLPEGPEKYTGYFRQELSCHLALWMFNALLFVSLPKVVCLVPWVLASGTSLHS